MSLAPGTRLGPHDVVRAIGAGGMGEVYQARDTVLNRDVALKVLPDNLAGDPERLARFEREARALAALNHPNIAQIYGLERDASRTPPVQAIVMELVEGDDLSDRIGGGPLPIADALSIARQIADALDAAHERGIVHRDLKPANVKVRDDGTVKVLDFGLAKTFEPEASDPSESPTVTADATARGTILGTAAYMSPEQARGRPVDKRTDIWAFACVLFEMLTGRRAFDGESVSDVLAAVLRSEPAWDWLPGDVPNAVGRVLRRALEKDPRRRLRDIGDLRPELEDATPAPQGGASVGAAHGSGGTLWLRLALAATTVTSVALGLMLALNGRDGEIPDQLIVRSEVTLPASHYIGEGPAAGSGPSRAAFVLSPDGRHLVYGAQADGVRRLFVRDLRSFDVRALDGTEDGNYPFFSPDGDWVGFVADNRLQKVRIDGGAPVPICDVQSIGRGGGTWSSKGTIIFSDGPPPYRLWQVADTGGTPEPLTDPAGESHHWPQVLPGSDAVVFTVAGGSRLAVLSLNTRTVELLDGVTNAKQARYVPTGHLVYASTGAVRAVPFNLETRTITGPPTPALDVPVFDSSGSGGTYFSVADDGTLAYLPGGTNYRLVWVDRSGRVEPLPVEPAGYRYPMLSPANERYLTVTIDPPDQGASDIWTFDAVSGRSLKLTDEGHQIYSVWTPDGRRIAYGGGGAQGFRVPVWELADGSGEVEPLASVSGVGVQAFSPDGAWFVIGRQNPGTSWDLFRVAVTGDRTPVPIADSRFRESNAEISPDGYWIAFASDESSRGEVWVQPFPDPGRKVQVSIGGGDVPVWTGTEIFYMNGPEMMAVRYPAQTGETFEGFGNPETLFVNGSLIGSGNEARFDVTRDGQRFLMVQDMNRVQGTRIALVQNWFEELRARIE